MIPAVMICFFPPAADIYVLPKLAASASLVAIGWLRARALFRKKLTYPLLAMFVLACVSAAFSGDPLVNIFGRHSARYLGLLPLAVCLLAYHLPAVDIEKEMQWAVGLMSVYSISLIFWRPLGFEAMSGRIVGSIGTPWGAGCALAMCLPFCLERRWLLVLGIVGIWSTGTRGAWVAAAASSMVYLAMAGRMRWGWLWAVPLGLGSMLLGDPAKMSLSDQVRLHTYRTSLEVGLLSPWIGVGGETFVHYWRQFRTQEWVRLVSSVTYQDHAHNSILMIWASFGLAGLLCMGVLSRYIWGQVARVHFSAITPRSNATAASLESVVVCSMFNAVPFPVLFALSLMLGAMPRGYAGPPRSAWPARVLAVGLASVSLWILGADMVYKLGRQKFDTGLVRLASRLNPTEIVYQIADVEQLQLGYGQTKDIVYLEEALTVARAAYLLHPVSVQAREAVTAVLVQLSNRDKAYLTAAANSVDKLKRADPLVQYRVIRR